VKKRKFPARGRGAKKMMFDNRKEKDVPGKKTNPKERKRLRIQGKRKKSLPKSIYW